MTMEALMPTAAVHVNSAPTQAAENPDISFGGAGSPQGWATVLARSGIGEIFNEAVDFVFQSELS